MFRAHAPVALVLSATRTLSRRAMKMKRIRCTRTALTLAVSLLVSSAAELAAAQSGAEGDTEIPSSFGFGRTASPDRIAEWDMDVMADGTGLPQGSGTVAAGAEIFAAKCASCHGATGTEGPEDVLVGRLPDGSFPFGDSLGVRRTIGNYWPSAPTLFDYIRRAMPFDQPGSLTDEEVYSVSAYLLHLNDLIPADGVMDANSLPQVEMPARHRFVPDDRLEHKEVH